MYVRVWLVVVAAAWVAVAGPGPPDPPPGAGEAAPELHFAHHLYNLSVPENSAPRTHAAQPPDEDPLGVRLPEPDARVRFRIRHGDKDKFFKAEERCVGDFCFVWIRTRAGHGDVLNRERRDAYRLQLRATATLSSGVQLAADTELALTVTDVNDLSPLFYPTQYVVDVPEDTPPHASVADVSAEDADLGLNGEIYYTLAEDTDTFTVHPVTGVVSVTRAISYQERSKYELTVLARDRASLLSRGEDAPAARASLTIRITPVNLHAPEFNVRHLPQLDTQTHPEGEVYAIVEVTDRDEGEHGRIKSVDIVDGDPDGHFRIRQSPDPGHWMVIALSLRESAGAPDSYNLTLRAEDAGAPPRTAYLTMGVAGARAVRPSPVFSREVYEAAVSEAAPPNTPLVRLKVAERDSRVYIEIVGGNEGGEFKVHADTGVLYTAVQLDAEKRARYTLTVAAVDRRGAPQQLAQSSAKVQITVLDANDNDPIFDEAVIDITLKENGPSGSVVTRLTARDADSGENAYISYSIVNLQPVPFEVEHFSGAVRTTRVLDYESMKRSYVIRVRASDWGLPYRRQADAEVRVTLVDVNDNRPQFERIDCVGYLPRNSPVGTEILTLSAIDFDAGDVVSYRIASGNEDNCLSLDSSTGVISVACELSSAADTLRVNVTATDGAHFADPSAVTVHVGGGRGAALECRDTGAARRLADLLAAAARAAAPEADPETQHQPSQDNLHAPEFLDFPVEVKVNESVALGTTLVKLRARDRDSGYDGLLQFGISAGDDDSVFRIDPDTGELQVIGYLDREREAEYYLNITVYDCGSRRKATSRLLPITVLDVNDNSPKFERPLLSYRVTENAMNGTAVCQLNATDPDGGDFGRVTYSVEGADGGEFCIDGLGVLRVCGTLDRERRALYELGVWATDGGGRSGEARVRVLVDDVNDCAPRFALPAYSARVREDEPRGALLAVLEATDPDAGAGGSVRYSLPDQSPDDHLFTIDERSGVLRTARALDYEDRQVYGVTVRATDGGQPALFSEATVIVEVLDVDENAHAPEFAERVLSARVAENVTRGSRVLSCEARDADPPGRDSRLGYYLRGGTGMGHFSVDDAGVIRTLAPLDHERTPFYWLTVCAEDHGLIPKHSCVPVYIEVSDVNDVSPWFPAAEYWASVAEGAGAGVRVATLTATDGDSSAARLKYRIVAGNPDGLFSIDEDTGEVVTTGRALDRSTATSHSLEVAASDGELVGHARLTVALLDVNDHAPVFTQRYYQLRAPADTPGYAIMQEDAAAGAGAGDAELSDASAEADADSDDDDDAGKHAFDAYDEHLDGLYIGSVLALDPDAGENGTVSYSMRARGAARGVLRVSRASGRVYATRALRRDVSYEAAVRACDAGAPPRCAVSRVSVRAVPPRPGGRPPRLPPPPPLQVAELDAPGFLLTLLTATDPDDDPLYYDIVDGDPRGEFYVGREDGSLVLARRLLWERQPLYRLNVSVTDTWQTVYTAVLVSVVNDLNEGGVCFSAPEYSGVAAAGARPGARLLTVAAAPRPPTHLTPPAPHAPPAAPTARILYGIQEARAPNSMQYFRLDELTGVLEVAKALDWEEAEVHELTIWARDNAPRASRALSRVTIVVSRGEETSVWWSRRLLQLRVPSSTPRHAQLARLAAATRSPLPLKYSLAGGGDQFRLDSETGELSLARALPARPPRDYTLHARAELPAAAAAAHATPTSAITTTTTPPTPHLPIHIVIVEPDDSPPVFASPVVECSVWEGSPPGTVAATLELRSGTAVRVWTRGPPALRTNPAAPILTTTMTLDYEDQDTYNITVVASNMGGGVAEASVIVHVLDRNEHAPRLTAAEFRGRLSEAAPPGSLVTRVNDTQPLLLTAEDRDSAAHQQRAFMILSPAEAQLFSVHPLTGAVSLTGDLDYEHVKEYNFMVKVVDMGSPRLASSSTARVIISVTDVNDVPPRFPTPDVRATILTPTAKDVVVTTLHADDPDTVPGTPIVYDIIEGDPHNIFRIENASILVNTPEYLGESYVLKVRASDGQLSSTSKVRVSVRGVEPAGLAFARPEYLASVVENSTRPHTVAVLSVLGAALNEHVHFTILNPVPGFEIGATSGAVRTTGLPLDRELRDNYTLLIEAASVGGGGGGVARVARTRLRVAVSDVNDNCPVFVHAPYAAAVRAGDPPGTHILTLHAIDADINDNGEVRYEMKRGHGELFQVARHTGVLTLRQSLDAGTQLYRLTLAARDGGTPACATETEVTVVVWGGGAAPAWRAAGVTLPAREGVAPLRLAPPLQADSPLARQLLYTLLQPEQHPHFQIYFDTGNYTLLATDGSKARDGRNNPCVLVVRTPLDYETARTHALTVRATDAVSGAHADLAVTVTVTDVNDCAPHFTQDEYHATVSEDAAVGDVVVAVAAKDNDTGVFGEVTYSLEWAMPAPDAPRPPFSISESGVVRVSAPLDAEVTDKYHLLVIAADKAPEPLTTPAHLFITVLDVNESPPVWERGVWEAWAWRDAPRHAPLLALRARDPDAAPPALLYRLHHQPDPPVYALHPTDGVLTLLEPSLVSATTLNVSVSDGARAMWARVRVRPAPDNAHAPRFPHALHEARVPENAQRTLLTTVKAFDEDEGEFGTIRYSIPSTALRDTFSINPVTGAVSTKVPLDRETRAEWLIPIEAADGGFRLGHTSVRVKVLDENDNAPIFPLPSYRTVARSDTKHTLINVWARDIDEGDNAKIKYELYDPETNKESKKHLFNIDSVTGAVTFAANVTKYEGGCVCAWVRAADGDGRAASAPVCVYVAPPGPAPPPPPPPAPAPALFLREDAAAGALLADLRHSDHVTVKMTNDDQKETFAVDEDGKLVLVGPLDRETQPVHYIGIEWEWARSGGVGVVGGVGGCGAAWSGVVTLRVLDVNEAAPAARAQPYALALAENTPPHTPVLQLMAEDPDAGSNGEVHYSLIWDETSNEEPPPFILDPSTGWLSTTGELDRETTREYRLAVSFSDAGVPRRSSRGTVIVRLQDYDDCPPKFTQEQYTASVREDAVPGTVLLRLGVEDADLVRAPKRFYIRDGDPNARFAIRDDGDVYVSRPLDRETQDSYKLRVLLVDGKFSAETTVVVSVTDVNDNPPFCIQHRYSTWISEAATVGTQILTVRVSDADLAENARNKLFLSGEDSEHFTLHKETGVLSVAAPLDRETRAKYSLHAHAQDPSRPQWKCTVEITIQLSDVNDNAPQFTTELYETAVSEDAELGTVVATLHATDQDSGLAGRVMYTLIDGGDILNIAEDTGVLRLRTALDRERQSSYKAVISASDRGTPPRSTTATLLLTVTDVNDNPPQFLSTSYAATVPETAAVGTQLLTVHAASDDAGVNADVYYSIVGGDESGQFSIDRKSGVVSIARPLDYETSRSHLLTIQAVDGGSPPLSDLATLNVTVLDANDNAPAFTAPAYSARVREDVAVGERVAQLIARDSDAGLNARLIYSIVGGNQEDKFTIDPDTGYVSVSSPLDRETVDSYKLEIEARDRGVPALATRVPLSVAVLDANDNPPRVAGGDALSAAVRSDRAPGHALLTLQVTDADAAPNAGPFTFDLQQGNETGAFRLEQDGTLRTAAPLHRRRLDTYTLQIRVFDNGSPPLFSDAWVTVHVVEESRYPPVVTPMEIQVISYKDSFPGGALAAVHAIDQDKADTLTFSLTPRHQLFKIEAESGVLHAAPRPDPGEYALNVTASDGKFTGSAVVRVLVRDVGDATLRDAAVLRFRAVSEGEFVLSHRKGLLRGVREAIGTEAVLLGVQAAAGGALDVALARRGGGAGGGELRRELHAAAPRLEHAARLVLQQAPRALCSCPKDACRETLQLDAAAVHSAACDVFALVAPLFALAAVCRDAGAPPPAASPRVLSFSGEGYMALAVTGGPVWGARPLADDIDISFTFRTRATEGTLFWAKGPVDYLIVEIVEGMVRVELELGGGAAAVAAGAAADGRWHAARVWRRAGWVRVALDAHVAHAHAPPTHASLDLYDDLLYVGAQLVSHEHALAPEQVTRGFIGCIGELSINGVSVLASDAAWRGEDVAEAAATQGGGVSVALRRREGVAEAAECPALPPPLPCHSYPCLNGGTCSVSASGSVRCACSARFGGARCELDREPCAAQPCLHGGVCTNTDTGFSCACPPGLAGARCALGRYCVAGACLHGGTCEEGAAGAVCRCRGYFGARCQYDADECAGEPCLNGATCLNEPGSFRCLCPPDKTGMNCGDPLHSVAVTLGGQGAASVWAALRSWVSELGWVTWAGAGGTVALLVLLAIVSHAACRVKPPPPPPPAPRDKLSNLHSSPPRRLNNMDTLRSYGSAGDELEGIPPDYRRNLNLEPDRKPWSEQMHLHTFTDNKIYNDLKGSKSPPPPLLRGGGRVATAGAGAGAGRGEPALAGGYHWDCSDWCAAPPPPMTEVPATDTRDSSSPPLHTLLSSANEDDDRYDFADGCMYPLHPDHYLPAADGGGGDGDGEGGGGEGARPPRLRDTDAASLITMLEERHSLLGGGGGGGGGGSCSDVSTRLCEIEDSDEEAAPPSPPPSPPPPSCIHTDV